MANENLKILYYRESFVQSVASDIFSFAILAGLLWLDVIYWHAAFWPTVVIVSLWAILLFSRKPGLRHTFTEFDKAIAYLQEEKAKQK